MRGKLLGFAIALFSVATIGIVQLNTNAAEPGKVGNAPLCKVTAVGERGSAFKINGANTLATVQYKVTGNKNCKAQVSTNSFNAPSMDGRPYDKQVLFMRVTKVVTPGTYKNSVGIPTNGGKGCFYQVDLTYGTQNVTPVIAYGHGKVNGCKKPPAPDPIVTCIGLTSQATSLETTKFTAQASAKNGAKINGYLFTVKKGSKIIKNEKKTTPSYSYTMTEPGYYSVRVTVLSSEGRITGPNCVKPINLKAPNVPEEPETPPEVPTPSVSIDKLVESADYLLTETGVEYTYSITVQNTGETILKDLVVSDTPEPGVTLLSATEGEVNTETNTFTDTIDSLAIDGSKTYTLTAVVPEYLAGTINNTACVDTPTIPGTPDDCDDAEVEVTKEGVAVVCNPDSGEIETVPEKDADKYLNQDNEACKHTPTKKVVENTPKALPTTGPAEVIAQLTGVAALAGSSAYYLRSRRQ